MPQTMKPEPNEKLVKIFDSGQGVGSLGRAGLARICRHRGGHEVH